MKKFYARERLVNLSETHFLKTSYPESKIKKGREANLRFLFLWRKNAITILALLCLLLVGNWASGQNKYVLVKSNSELTVNGKYILVNKKVAATDAIGMSWQNTNNRPGVPNTNLLTINSSLEITTNIATVKTDQNLPYEITLEGSSGAWNLFDAVNNQYLRPRTGANNGLQGQANTIKANWTINIESTYEATMVCGTTTDYPRNILRYNPNNGSPLYACYASGQNDFYLYKLVSDPTLTTDSSSLSGFSYVVGSGPSTSHIIKVSGSNLTPASGNITITGSTNYEVSTDNVSFGSPKTIAYTGGALSSTTVYVRLKTGLSVGTYNENITIEGGGVSTFNFGVNGSVKPKLFTSVKFGDWFDPTVWDKGSVPQSYDDVNITGYDIYANSAITRDAGTTTTIGASRFLYMGATYTNNGVTNINGTFQLNDGSWATGNGFVYGSSGTLIFNKTSGSEYGVNNDAFWPTTNGPVNVTVLGQGIKMNVSRTISGKLTAVGKVDMSAAGYLTINGTLQLETGGFFQYYPPIYGVNSTLIYNTTYGVNNEWTGNASTAGSGVPHNVTILSGTLSMTTTDRGLAGNLTISSGATLTLNGSSGDLYVGGNWERASGATFNHSNRAVFFNGKKTQTINAISGQTANFAYLIIGAGSGTTIVQLGADVNVGNIGSTGNDVGSVLNLGGSNDVLDLNGKKLTVGKFNVTSTISGTGSFKGSATSSLELNGSGGISDLKFFNDLNLKDLKIYRTVENGYNLASNLTINGTLTLTRGSLTLGNFDLIFQPSATVTDYTTNTSLLITNGTGQVKKVFDNSNKTFTYPLGNRGSGSTRIYTPATLDFTGTTFSGTATVGVGVNPTMQPYTSNIAASYIERYWTISKSNLPGTYSVAASFTYNTGSPTDLVGTEGDMKIAGYTTGAAWTTGSPVNTTTHSMSVSTTSLLDAYTAGDDFPKASSATDYFRTKTGAGFLWNNNANWESSVDSTNWYTSTLVPTSTAKNIVIKDSMVLNANTSVKFLTINNGGRLNHLNSNTLTVINDGTFTVNNGGIYIVNGVIPQFTGTGIMIIYSGGKVRADTSAPNNSADITFNSAVTFKTGSIFDWNTTRTLPTSSNNSFFKNNAEIPIFRISKQMEYNPGHTTTTTFYGILEVNANLTFDKSGEKIFRDGIIGSAILNLPSVIGKVSITGTAPILGGKGLVINSDKPINITNDITVPLGDTLTINGTSSFSKGVDKIFTVNGVLDLTTFNITNTSGSVDVNGTLKTSNVNGLWGTNTNISSGTLNLNTGSTIEYNATDEQKISNSTSWTYYNIVLSGGTKTFTTVRTTGQGTISILGPNVFIDATSSNFGTTAVEVENKTNFTMTGGRLIIGSSGQQPNMGGTYNITGGTIEFAYKKTGSTTNQTIRPKIYQNIEISGDSVQNSNGNIQLNPNGKFIVKNGGVYINTSNDIRAATGTGQQVIVEEGGFIKSISAQGFYGSSGAGSLFSTINSNISPSNILLAPTSTIEFAYNGDQTTKLGGITYGNIILSGSGQKIFEGVVSVAGNITANTDMVLNSTTKGFLYLGGTSDQTISGTGNLYLHTLEINKNSGTVNLQRNINQIDNHLTFSKGLLKLDAGVEINLKDGAGITGGGGNFSTDALGKIVFEGASVIDGSSAIDFYPEVYLTPTVAKGVNFGTHATIHKLLQLNAGSYVAANAPSYASGSLLKYNNGGSYDRSVEWSQTSGGGYPYNVQISNNTILNPAKGDASFQNTAFNIAGNLTIDNGSSIRMDYGEGAVTGMLQPLVIGGNLNIDGALYASIQPGGDIQLNGNWTRGATGKFYPNNRAVFFLGSTNSEITVNAPEHSEYFPYLILDKTTNTTSLSLNDSVELGNKFTFTKGALDLKDKDFTFRSRDENTASITALNGTDQVINYSGTGRFVVERYSGNHKAWQFFSVPTKGSTFKNAWQEGTDSLQNTGKGGYGTMLTGTTGTTGYDYTSPQPSLKTFNPTTQKYEEVPNTNNSMNTTSGYMVFVRGDRSVAPTSSGFSSTILRTRGKIYEPGAEAPAPITVPQSKFGLIGNPYPSAIDFYKLSVTNIDPGYYIWDPNLTGSHGTGGFRTISGGIISPPYEGKSPTEFYPIQSGQAFFVRATADGDGSVTIPETSKEGGSVGGTLRIGNRSNVFPPDAKAYLSVNLYRMVGAEAVLLDGVISLFHGEYNPLIDMWDAEKMPNPSSENMGIRSHGYVLAIERTTERASTDTIFYKMNNYKVASYRFEFEGMGMETTGQDAFLYDKFLNTYTPINANGHTIYNFDIKSNPPGSWDENRFMIVFRPNGPVPVTLTNIKAYTQNKDVMVEWTAATESNMKSYTVETSLDGKTFTTGGTVAAKNIDGTVYHWLDVAPVAGYHYYRILSTGLDGKVTYSKIVSVLVGGNASASISIYPNPIKDGVMNVQFENQEAGVYQLRVLNTVGQVMMTNTINHVGGNGSQKVKLPSTLVKGMYQVEVWKGSERVMSEKVVY